MSESVIISSHKGDYALNLDVDLAMAVNEVDLETAFWLVDRIVFDLYGQAFESIKGRIILLDSSESSKDINAVLILVKELLESGLRRDCRLVAVGGGVVQDITCFIASIFMRGIPWYFFPTTLLAQADSCIGSKSSINLSEYKNVFGTFNPPVAVYQSKIFLDSLGEDEIFAGIGEILKVSGIDSKASLDKALRDISQMRSDRCVLQHYVNFALKVKRRYIEIDEFDKSERIVFNLGHSFGHAIESASNFGVQHGIAVCIGLDMAFYVAARFGLIKQDVAESVGAALEPHYSPYLKVAFCKDSFISALRRDKKNKQGQYGVILPEGELCTMMLKYLPMNSETDGLLLDWLGVKFCQS